MPPRGGYTWDQAAGRYRDARGRFVPRAAVRSAIDDALARANARARSLAEQLRGRRISLADWTLQMRGLVKEVHLYSAAAAKGGWDQLSPADYGRVGQVVRGEYAFLQRFAADIAAGRPLDGRFLRRVELYAQAGRRTYHQVERADMEVRGYDLEENILGPADHCDECPSLTAQGPVPIGTLPPIGTRTCLANCRCRIRYRNSETGAIAA